MAEEKKERTLMPDSNATIRPVDSTNPMEIISSNLPTSKTDSTQNTSNGGDAVIAAGSVTFLLKGKQYTASRTISESTGEAQIILVERDGVEYILKLYYPNFHINESVIQCIWNVNVEFLMKVFDYGVTSVNGSDRDYELMEYLHGGTLSTYVLGENMRKFRHIALQGAAALACLHNWGIIHKDVKPGNFFFRDTEGSELVLGDFGISTKMKDNDDVIRTSQARTPAFAAPEMYDDVIDGEVEIDQRVDYYSLGITLLYLWLGHSPFGKNERLMMRMKQEGRLPHINEIPAKVGNIIKGLTCNNPAKRWGYDEVERWFRGEDVPVDTSSAYLRYKTFILDADRNLSAHDLKELVPLLYENKEVGIQFLYSKRISQWLDECGNAKMAVLLNDIVDHRYTTNQQAGLIAAIYTMDPNFPYYDIHGDACDNLSDVAMSLLKYNGEYEVVLQDAYNPLFIYIECKGGYAMDRLRSYFEHPDDKSVVKLVYELDAELPFLSMAASNSLSEILTAFSMPDRTSDEWMSLVDGRFLAWLYARQDITLIETTRQWMERKDLDPMTRAYSLFYNLDRACGYDLAEARNEVQVAQIMAQDLLKYQDASDEEFTTQMSQYYDKKGRLAIYADLRRWYRVKDLITRYFDFESVENKDRFSLYDLRTAMYKLCVSMGGVPQYRIHSEEGDVVISTQDDLGNLPVKAVRDEIRQGVLRQWLSVFYHEDPSRDFKEPFSYEHALEGFLLTLGTWDPSEMHYKRYCIAEEQMERKMQESKEEWNRNIQKQKYSKYLVGGLSGLWLFLNLVLGIHNSQIFHDNIYYYVCLPIGTAVALQLVVWSYFRGHGFMICLLWAIAGALSSFIPAYILDLTSSYVPGALRWVCLLLSIVYVAFAIRACFHKSGIRLDGLQGVFTQDPERMLQEKLFYTFKTKSFKFKGSNFGTLDDAVDESRAASYEKLITCFIWGVLLLLLVILFFIYHPSLFDHSLPDIQTWKNRIWDLYFQVKSTR